MKDLLVYVLAFIAIFAVMCGGWVCQSYNEARTYNKLTGNSVSTWDALWVELRVQDAPTK